VCYGQISAAKKFVFTSGLVWKEGFGGEGSAPAKVPPETYRLLLSIQLTPQHLPDLFPQKLSGVQWLPVAIDFGPPMGPR
jgi:hypothetical protein